ncbi:MAG: hypothetical protein N2654_00255 [Deltaproteobacteria bacterium]|nr:hypothetical protein [Deltaproteobacteria bacterium]
MDNFYHKLFNILIIFVCTKIQTQITIGNLQCYFNKVDIPADDEIREEYRSNNNTVHETYSGGFASGHPSISSNNTVTGNIEYAMVTQTTNGQSSPVGPRNRGYRAKIEEQDPLNFSLIRKGVWHTATVSNDVNSYVIRSNGTYLPIDIFAGAVRCSIDGCSQNANNPENRYFAAYWSWNSVPTLLGPLGGNLNGMFSQLTSVDTYQVQEGNTLKQYFAFVGHKFEQTDNTFDSIFVVRNHTDFRTYTNCILERPTLDSNAPPGVPQGTTAYSVKVRHTANGFQALVVGKGFVWIPREGARNGELRIGALVWDVSRCVTNPQEYTRVSPTILPSVPHNVQNPYSVFSAARRLYISEDGSPFVVGYTTYTSQGRNFHHAVLWTLQNGQWILRLLPHVSNRVTTSRYGFATGITEFNGQIVITGFTSPSSTTSNRIGTMWVGHNLSFWGFNLNPHVSNLNMAARERITWGSDVNSNLYIVGRKEINGGNDRNHVILKPSCRLLTRLSDGGGAGWASLRFKKIRLNQQRRKYRALMTFSSPDNKDQTSGYGLSISHELTPQLVETSLNDNRGAIENFLEIMKLFGIYVPPEIESRFRENINPNTGIGENPNF